MRPAAAFLAVLALPAVWVTPATAQEARFYAEGRQQVRELAGKIEDGARRLLIETDLGAVRVRAAQDGAVSYRVRVRVRGVEAAEARRRLERMVISASLTGDLLQFTGSLPPGGAPGDGLNAEFDIAIPARIRSVEVSTGGGEVEVQGAGGQVNLLTRGGSIIARDIGGPLVAETRGGNIVVGGVSSSARLVTAGGIVTVESAGGELSIQTHGGDVRVIRAGAGVRAESGGGNVRIGSAVGAVRAATAGGTVEVGQAGGEVVAASAGGGIRVGSATGGVRCETAAGPIVLDGVRGPFTALTSAGSIRALLSLGGLLNDSNLRTLQGDIFVSLPEALPVTIRALVDDPIGQAIESEFPLTILRETEDDGRPLETAEGAIGGGGPVLTLRTLGGRIHILKAKSTITTKP